MDEAQEIKNRLDIVEIIDPYVKLKKAGKSYKGLCPFHSEKTPSFVVTPSIGIYKCFGCGETGDMFSFLQKIDGLEFKEALDILAKRAGVVLSQKEKKDYTPLYTANEIASKFFRHCLLRTEIGKPALRYLKEERGLSDTAIEQFNLGYAPDSWNSLLNALTKKGLKVETLEAAGLVIKGNRGYYDRFRNRVIFPFHNTLGKMVGFSGRALAKEDTAKYINTPETPIFHKGEILYGLYVNKQGIRDRDLALVVEGHMDVISTTRHGLNFSVASGGTSLTEDHIRLLKRFTNNAVFAFDSDSAGFNALKRAIDLGEQNELNVKVLVTKNFKDPDEAVRKNPKLFERMVKEAPIVYDYLIGEYTKQNIQDPAQRKRVAAEAVSVINKIRDPVNRDHYLTELAETLGVSKRVLSARQTAYRDPNKAEKREQETKTPSNAEFMLSLLHNHPILETIYKNEIKRVGIETLKEDLEKSDKEYRNYVVMLKAGVDEGDAKKEFEERLRKKKIEYLQNMIRKTDPKKINSLINELNILKRGISV